MLQIVRAFIGHKKSKPYVEALRISVPYLVVGCLWIGFSDRLLSIPNDIPTMIIMSSLKGWFYVIVTAILVFLLVRARAGKLWQYQEHLEDMIRERTSEYEEARQQALDYSAEKDKALEHMSHHAEFEGIVLHFAQELIGIPIDNIETKLADTLRQIARHLNEDWIFYAEYDYNLQICSSKVEWYNPLCGPAVQPGFTRPFELIKDILEVHERGEVCYISNVLTNGRDDELGKQLKQENSPSFITIPVQSNGKPYGCIGISLRCKQKTWQQDDLAILKIFAEMVRNIFERRDRELMLQKNNRNMRVLLDSTNDGIFLIDRSGIVININNAAAAFVDMTVEEATGSKLQDIMPAQMMDQQVDILRNTFKTGKEGHFFGQRDHLWIDTRYYPVFEPDGSVSAVATYSTDLTERVNAENEIFKSRQMLREVIDNAPVGIFWSDRENRILGKNRVVGQITGFTEDELGGGDDLLFAALTYEQTDDNLQILLSGKPKLNYEARIVDAQGETRILNMSKVPLLDKEGKPYALLGVVEDMTEQKRMIQELVQARQEAFDASKAKSTFLSMMSHEIRTPINSVIGLTHIARHSSDPLQLSEYLDKIDFSSRHLLDIINDILDISRIEAGKMSIKKAAFDFEAFIEETVGIVQPKADEKKQDLDVFLGSGIPRRFVGDPMRLKQVLVNLLSNAVKFTPALGKITVRVSVAEKRADALIMSFSVEDNGIGIPSDKLGSLFYPFEQLDKKAAREHSGTGLGLAISKNLVELMGGSISVRSAEDMGSEFSFTIPLEVAPAVQQADRMNFSDLRVLVVDDEPEACEYMESMLKGLGVRCDSASGGRAAIEKVAAAADCGMLYNVAIVDWRMPDMNGIETSREIRRISGEQTNVIMISKYDLDDAGDQMGDAGISLFLLKPVFPSRLLGILKEITSGTQPTRPKAQWDIRDVFEGKKILVVEDMEINQMIIREMLRETSAEIFQAFDGAQALEIFMGQGGEIDAILMDVQMPGKDGYETTRQIRTCGQGNAATVPIIAMTANVYKEDVELAIHSGMNAHIGKPIDFEILYNKLREYLI